MSSIPVVLYMHAPGRAEARAAREALGDNGLRVLYFGDVLKHQRGLRIDEDVVVVGDPLGLEADVAGWMVKVGSIEDLALLRPGPRGGKPRVVRPKMADDDDLSAMSRPALFRAAREADAEITATMRDDELRAAVRRARAG